MKRIFAFFALLALALALCAGPARAASAWEGRAVGLPGYWSAATNASMGPAAATLGPSLPTFNATSDTYFDFFIPTDAQACSAGSLKDITLHAAFNSAMTKTGAQSTNSSWMFNGLVFEANFRSISANGATGSWSAAPIRHVSNQTGGAEDYSAGELLDIGFHGQITGLSPGDVVQARISRNATNSADNATAILTPLSVTWKNQDCPNQ